MNRKSLSLALLLSMLASPGGTQQRVVPTLHVAMTGSDKNPGTQAAPFKTVQHAVDAARAGDAIMVHAGTYRGVVEIKKSGAVDLPIVLRSAGDGEAILTADFPRTACASGYPTRNRTVQVLAGADWWVIKDLTVVNGILVAGKHSNILEDFTQDRDLPGRGQYDPVGAVTLLPMLGVDPSDHIRIARNKVTRRGIQITASRWSEVVYNEISGIECGTGSGILLSRFSDFATVRGNFVHHNSLSFHHPMEEGIRLGSGTNYSVVAENLVEDMVGRGRGFATDTYSSWNRIFRNTARRAAIGFNEEDGGWGNHWYSNRAENVREVGFKVDGKDNHLTVPTPGVPAYIRFTSNCSLNNPGDLGVGAIQASEFLDNSFTKFQLSKNVIAYWAAVGNKYDGSTKPPTNGGVTKAWCS